jgi:hypothetical protein
MPQFHFAAVSAAMVDSNLGRQDCHRAFELHGLAIIARKGVGSLFSPFCEKTPDPFSSAIAEDAGGIDAGGATGGEPGRDDANRRHDQRCTDKGGRVPRLEPVEE